MSDPLPDLMCPDCNGKGQKYLHLNYGKGDGRSVEHWATIPVGRCLSRIAVSVLFLC